VSGAGDFFILTGPAASPIQDWPVLVDDLSNSRIRVFYCSLHKNLNFIVLNDPEIMEPWFKYLRSTLLVQGCSMGVFPGN
jgi:hypothetical protein